MLLTDPSRFCRISWLTIPAAVAYGYAMNTTPNTDTTTATATYLIRTDDADYIAADVARSIDRHAIVLTTDVRRVTAEIAQIAVRFVSPKHEVVAHKTRGLHVALHYAPTDLL